MTRWLKSVRIPIPKNFLELQEFSEQNEQWKKLLTYPKDSLNIKYDAVADDGSKVCVIGNPDFIKQFKGTKVLFMDCTYKSRPKLKSVYQLLTFMVNHNKSVSILFIHLTK